MAAPTPFGFYEDMFRHLDTALTTYVGGVASSVIGAITNVASSLLLLYMVLWGWAMLRGMISEPITDGVVRIVRLSLIVGIALSASRYSMYVSDFLWASPEALAGVIAGSGGSTSSNVQFLDTLLTRIFGVGEQYLERAWAGRRVIPDIGMSLVALAVWGVGVVSTAYAAFLLALAKMALAILLGIGPIFVLLLIFDGTKRFFDAWIGQALNFVFLVTLTAGAIRLILTIISTYLGPPPGAAVQGLDEAFPLIAMCIVAWLVMMQLPSIASALGGGVAIGTLGAAGWAFNKARGATGGAFGAMRPTNARRSLNRLRSDARIVGGVYRRITGRDRNRVEPTS